MLSLQGRVDLEAMALKEYSAFPKAPTLLKPHYQIACVMSRTLIGGVLPLCKDAVGVFYSPSQLGLCVYIYIYIYLLDKSNSSFVSLIFVHQIFKNYQFWLGILETIQLCKQIIIMTIMIMIQTHQRKHLNLEQKQLIRYVKFWC